MTKQKAASDKAIHTTANKIKSDLNIGADVQVPKGDEPNPVLKPNPFDARKAMFAKANAIADAASQGFSEGDAAKPQTLPKPDAPKPEDIEAAQREAAGNARVGEADETPVAKQNEYVTVQTPSGAINVLQADLDRAGGPEMYLAQRALDSSRAALELERSKFAQQQREWEQRQLLAAEHGVPANSSSGQDGGSRGTGDGDEVEAERLAAKIYSGDPDEAKEAIRALLGRIHSGSAEAVEKARLAAGQPAQPKPDPVMVAMNNAINEMTARDYPDVCNDPVARAASYEKFKQLASDPLNKDRRALDIARDACEWGRNVFKNPRSQVVESKRGLPPVGSATSAASVTETDEEPAKPAEVVAMMQDYRNFGRRVKQ